MIWTGTIPLAPVSKANSRRLVTHNGKPRFIKSDKALAFMQGAGYALRRPKQLITVPVALICRAFYENERPDTDISLVMDALQEYGVVKNDRLLRDHYVTHAIDKQHPRVEVEIHLRDRVRVVIDE